MKTYSNSPPATVHHIVASVAVTRSPADDSSLVPEHEFTLPLSDTDAALILGKLTELPHSISVVQRVVGQVFGVTVNQMIRTKRGHTSVSDPRLVALAISEWAHLASQHIIESRFARTHGSVINACKRVSAWVSHAGPIRQKYHQTLLALVLECHRAGITFPRDEVKPPQVDPKSNVVA